jgi:hypothetical protein
MNSQGFNALTANTVTLIEYNADSLNSDISFAGNGTFVVPSPNVPGRPNDITGFVLTSINSEGKISWSDITTLGLSLEDLSDVNITNIMSNDILVFNGNDWINQQIDTSGIKVLNGLTTGIQDFQIGTIGSDFNISSIISTHTFNLPSSSASARGALTPTDWNTFNDKLSTFLPDSMIWIGNTFNIATPVLVSGDATIANNGILTLSDITPSIPTGSYINTSLTVDSKGRITAASTGSDNGILSINTLIDVNQFLVTGTDGGGLYTDFTIISSGDTHTFYLPNASASARGVLTSTDWSTFNDKLTGTLISGNIFVGNGSNVATSVTMDGDATLADDGVLTLKQVLLSTPGYYTNVNLTVDDKGRVLTIESGLTSNGILSLNTLITTNQFLVTGTDGGGLYTDFTIISSGDTHTFYLPNASASARGLLTSTDWNTFNNKLSTSLFNKKIWIGDGGGLAVERDISGDATISNTGELTLSDIIPPLTPAGYTNANITVDAKGRVVAISNGSSSGGILSINSLIDADQFLVTGTDGGGLYTDFTIISSGDTHTFYLPNASASARGALTSTDWSTFNNKLSTSLSNKKIWIGNGVAVERDISGDATIDNTGILTLSTIIPSVLPTPYNNATITVDSKGRITAVSSGTSILSINTYTQTAQTLQVGTGGTDFGISSSSGIHTFNLPNASASARGALTITDWNTFNGKLSTSLSNKKIWIGNGVAVERDISGDATINNTGALTLSDIVPALTPATYTNATLTVDSKGRVISVSSGVPIGGIVSINTYTQTAQTLQVGTGGTDFGISSSSGIHTFNLPNSSGIARGALTSSNWNTFNNKLSPALPDGTIWIGNGSVATPATMGGDAIISNTGILTLSNIVPPLTPATYTNATITVDFKGRVTSISNGSVASSPGGVHTSVQFNNSGTFGGSSDFTWNAGTLSVNNTITNTVGDLNLTAFGKITGTSGSGQAIQLLTGDGVGAGNAGNITVNGGGGGGLFGSGGSIFLISGNTSGSGNGGSVNITAGNTTSGISGSVNITAGNSNGRINLFTTGTGETRFHQNGSSVLRIPTVQSPNLNYSLFNSDANGTSFWGLRDYANITLTPASQSVTLSPTPTDALFTSFFGASSGIIITSDCIELVADKLYQLTFSTRVTFSGSQTYISFQVFTAGTSSFTTPTAFGQSNRCRFAGGASFINSVTTVSIMYSTYSSANRFIRIRVSDKDIPASSVVLEQLASGVVIVQM